MTHLVVAMKKKPDPPPAPIDWKKLFTEKFEKALENAIGAKLGELFLDALLGLEDKDAVFRTEVIARLDRIEKKLDDVLRFIYTELPDLVARKLSDEIKAQNFAAIRSWSIHVQAEVNAIAALRREGNEPTLEELRPLVDAANACLRMGHQIIGEGPEWYLAGIHAFTAGLAGYARVNQKAPFRQVALATFASEYHKIVNPWIDSNAKHGKNLHALQKKLEEELLLSQEVIPPITTGRRYYVISWFRETPTSRFLACGWFEILGDGRLNGDDTYFRIEGATDDFDNLPTLFAATKLELCPGWIPVNSRDPQYYYDRFVDYLNFLRDAHEGHAAKVAQLAHAIDTLTPFTEGLVELARPVSDDAFMEV